MLPIPTPAQYGYLIMSDGNRIDLHNPDPAVMGIEIIAHTLSKLCRFGGHVKGDQIYSVAQHSVFVSKLVPPEFAFEGLMHDATEAFCIDLPKPIKQLLPDYDKIETTMWRAICIRYQLPLEMSDEVKHADVVAVITEARDLQEGDDEKSWYPGIAPHPNPVWTASPRFAELQFLSRYKELTGLQTC